MKNLIKFFVVFLLTTTYANAACDFIIDIGDKGQKLFDIFAPPMPMFEGQYMLPMPSNEVCPSEQSLNEMIAVEYVFLGENEESSNLAAIRMIALNDGKNTEANKLTLMNYAKKVYGNFDTGQNPKIFNSYNVWEKGDKIIVYQRLIDPEELIDEEIYISNKEYDEKLGIFYSNIEMMEAEKNDEN